MAILNKSKLFLAIPYLYFGLMGIMWIPHFSPVMVLGAAFLLQGYFQNRWLAVLLPFVSMLFSLWIFGAILSDVSRSNSPLDVTKPFFLVSVPFVMLNFTMSIWLFKNLLRLGESTAGVQVLG